MRALGPVYTQPEPFQWSRDNRDFQPYACRCGAGMAESLHQDKRLVGQTDCDTSKFRSGWHAYCSV
jgi:hypothetical protein